jgi:hypothetical protein
MKDPKAKSDFLKELYSYRRDQLKEEINDIRDEDYQRANLLLADRLLHARNTTLFHAGCALLGWMLPSSTVQTQPSLIKALATARECALEFKAEKHQELLKHLDDALRQVPLPRLGQQMLSDLTGHLGEWGGDARLPTARFILSYNQQLQDIGTHSPMRTAIYVFSVLMIGYFVAHEMNKVYRQKNVSAGDLKTISIYTASLLFFFFIRNYFLPRR